MDGNKRRGSQDFEDDIEPLNKLPKSNGNSNNIHEQNSGSMWIYSNVSMKRNRIVESDNNPFLKSQKYLRRILSPNPQRDNGSSMNDADSGDARNSNKNLAQSPDAAVKPIDESFRDIMNQLTGEIMNYEVKLASLYGKVEEMKTENVKIRNRYTLMCRGVVGSLGGSNDFDQSVDTEEFSSDDETCASDGTEACDEPEMMNDGGKNEEFGVIVPSERFSKLKDELDTLETRILNRFEELQENQKSTNNTSPNDLERLGVNLEDIPLVKNLRTDLRRSLEELKEVRKFTDIRVSNLKSTLTSERKISATARRDFESSKVYVKNAADFVNRANSHIEQYKLVNQTQHNVIESLQRQLANVQEKIKNTQVQSASDQKNVSDEYRLVSEKYQRIFTAYTVLNSISQKQKSDVALLHHLYEEEKRKSVSLIAVVEQQRKLMNPTRYMGPITASEALTRLSALYDNRCDESAREERTNLARMATIHVMYKNLLDQKDREHQGAIENLVRELNELKGINTAPQKSDPSGQSRDIFDGDVDRAMANPEQHGV
ncbi:hypothetical protein ZYGR_0A04330 [Zygosaccharomyces rouxii]|uniref:ZYRO0A09812p n=2 Tax=Zygosaccharomyces rouxii TaxID=4956 RepID=C5DQ99_ZYGRC|nr:uncharacterized protein ZYRO0A09812g [Zygosaccharomyces rouxii]KAH9198621.1 hypothetical protein LQ764DRAFT_139216 [Zygosaccharomyces rouxii]GAV46835.1 hypothetical protein ZYGR_0A04330 [Zygosaccharomyces rouxii]CAR25860.1 ZYRO0A09812p [Zygosaccharomyces rouxii]